MADAPADPPPSAPPGAASSADAPLIRQLASELAAILRPNSVIVCVGNELRGDDGAGVAVARGLADRIPWQVFNALTVPENCLMKIVAAAPDSVLFIDALHFNAAPGTIRLFPSTDLDGPGPSTHGPSPQVFLSALEQFHPCIHAILGIQPQSLDLDAAISAPVAAAIDQIIAAFHLLAGPDCAGELPPNAEPPVRRLVTTTCHDEARRRRRKRSDL